MATTPHATPSRDPADDGSLLGMIREVLKKHLQGVDDMLPARVLSYDRNTNRARVLPLVRLLTTDNRQVSRAPIASVPVLQYGGGGFVLSFNLKAGDLGWIKANDRDISLFLQTYGEQAPNTVRLHSFSDAVFIPDVMTGYDIGEEDAENAVLQSLDGNVKISLGEASLKLAVGGTTITLTEGGVEVVGETTFKDPVIMEQTLDVTGNTTLAATLAVTGAASFVALVTMGAGATIGGIPFSSHRHLVSGIQTGGGSVNSGGAMP